METITLQTPRSSESDISAVNPAAPSALSPEQLAVRCQSGCRDSFEILVEMFERRIFNFLCQITRNSHDAEDLTQDTFVKVFRNINRYQSAYAFSTWLFTIAKRTAYSHLRSTKPSEELTVENDPDFDDPSVLLQRKDDGASIWSVAKKLKPNQYEVLWLRYGEGFSVAETAHIMNTNQIYVKVLLHRGRRQLAKLLKHHETDFQFGGSPGIVESSPKLSEE